MKRKDAILKHLWSGIARAVTVTSLAFLLSIFLLQPLSFSALSIFSAPEKKDFTITDLYAQVANNRPVRTIDRDIFLVDIGHSKRNEIAEIINLVNFWQPRVVGVDVLFAATLPDDSLLLTALNETERLILPVGLEETPDGDFEIADTHFFYPEGKATYAASNLPAKFEGATIREFATDYPLKGGDSILSFPKAIAKAYDPQSLSLLNQRNNKYETIDYPSHDYVTLTQDEIAEAGQMLTDKIVLIGSISDGSDMHSTPVNHYMSGLSIHAASVSTILNGQYYDPAFAWPAWVPACILCFLVLLLRELTKEPKLKGLLTRLLQIVIVYCAVRIGYHYYVDERRIFDFSYTLLMVTFGLLAADIWLGVVYLVTKSSRVIVRLFRRNN